MAIAFLGVMLAARVVSRGFRGMPQARAGLKCLDVMNGSLPFGDSHGNARRPIAERMVCSGTIARWPAKASRHMPVMLICWT